MITEEMLCAAVARSCELYTADLESGYNADVLHEFSPAFEKKIRKLKRRADHPAFYRTMNRVASILLAILIAIGAWISVDAEARAAVVGWVKEIYETYFVYRFEGNSNVNRDLVDYRPITRVSRSIFLILFLSLKLTVPTTFLKLIRKRQISVISKG